MNKSELENALLIQMMSAGLTRGMMDEYRFAPPRRWRMDFAFPDLKLGIEVEGGTWANGRHSRGAGMAKDAEKYNEAALLGWVVLRFTADQVRDRSALATIERALTLLQSGGG